MKRNLLYQHVDILTAKIPRETKHKLNTREASRTNVLEGNQGSNSEALKDQRKCSVGTADYPAESPCFEGVNRGVDRETSRNVSLVRYITGF